jgi:hypothetical protein
LRKLNPDYFRDEGVEYAAETTMISPVGQSANANSAPIWCGSKLEGAK